MNPDNKEVLVGERRYRIIRMTPLVGARIINVLFSAVIKTANSSGEENTKSEKEDFEKMPSEEKAKISIQSMWMAAAAILSSDAYEEIQKASLRCCQLFVQEDAPPSPVMMASGRWAITEPSVTVASQLIVESLQFNLAPFFIESESKPADSTAPLKP
jgi:hypothetical protein